MTVSKKTTDKGAFQFPPSIQSDLFNYLKPAQQEYIKPILRVMKKPAQEELCISLLDYLENGEVSITHNAVVDGMFIYLTRYNLPEEDSAVDKRIIRPLRCRNNEPLQAGDIINRFFSHLNSKDLIS